MSDEDRLLRAAYSALEARYPGVYVELCALQRVAGVSASPQAFQTFTWIGARKAIARIVPKGAFRERGYFVDDLGSFWSAHREGSDTWYAVQHVPLECDGAPANAGVWPVKAAIEEVNGILRRLGFRT
jgi:hypothetical protein